MDIALHLFLCFPCGNLDKKIIEVFVESNGTRRWKLRIEAHSQKTKDFIESIQKGNTDIATLEWWRANIIFADGITYIFCGNV